MEEKKLDVNSLIGFGLIFVILIYMFYINQPTPEELAAKQQAEREAAAIQGNSASTEAVDYNQSAQAIQDINPTDSSAVAAYKSSMGAFSFTSIVPGNTLLENDVLRVEVSHKGGQLVLAQNKKYNTYDSVPVYLIKDGNATFNISFTTQDNRIIQTKDLYFEPLTANNDQVEVLSMKAKISDSEYLLFEYSLPEDSYMLDFKIKSVGLSGFFNPTQDPQLQWDLKTIRHSKSVQYENRYTRLNYKFEEDKLDKLSDSSDDDATEQAVEWVSYRQHFFSTIIAFSPALETASFNSTNLIKEESKTIGYTKIYETKAPLQLVGGVLDYDMNVYLGPTDVKELAKFPTLGLEDSIPFGWGIFGWINRYVFTPTYTFLIGYLPYGIAIIVMTILVRLLMSPVTYKSYLSQAKMKVLKPEITEINDKFKDNAMKKQQETMKIYNKAGVNPMSGCVPALVQMPIFYALFMFFPTSFALRQKSFLWADDLSSYDTILELPFYIPFYGDHVSLFPILASVAIFFYMMMTTGQNMPTQPGMPNMKFIIYLSPVMMLIFFNSYASGLSLYYFVSNLITIFIMLAIKNFILDDDKIHARIQANKEKPKKEGKFQAKMREIMEQAEAKKNQR
ncbi:membrane protein insertase YidC [Flavobacteriaceae bacterium]|nr:membrane protein insertase YidC [Flavobacteriaceae bacterium]MDA9252607.1 membrane protein insertase YidC [Flavobacteriaceae bacterium]MDA9280669.1 membrane protein insertase YidC [Flavobacteriaceae bacterium]MDA9364617.1 membrane protein insertase YidC [Flavobacteriaceae bacterium]MDA9928597.1 membrane protein insertase YidC [Flavobacteriaceae bacterium]